MWSDGGRLLAASDQDPVITYTRISPDGERSEPRFATPPRAARRRDGPQELAEITAPPLFDDLPPEPPFGDDGLPRAEFRQMRRAHAPRLVAIAGVFAVLTGAGVLAATFGGIVHLDGARIAHDGSLGASADATASGAAGEGVRIVALPISPTSNTAALLGGTVDVSLDTGVQSGRLIADPPLPRLRPATASANPPQPAAPADVATQANSGTDPKTATDMNPGADVNAAAAVNAGADANADADVDSAFAAVDRIIAEEKARAASMATPGAAYAGRGGSVAAPQPLAYPVLQPLPGADPSQHQGCLRREAAVPSAAPRALPAPRLPGPRRPGPAGRHPQRGRVVLGASLSLRASHTTPSSWPFGLALGLDPRVDPAIHVIFVLRGRRRLA